MTKGVLYLLPNTLGDPNTADTIPAGIPAVLDTIDVYIVENLRNARRYLKLLNREIDIDRLVFHELNEHTPAREIPGFLTETLKGSHTAILSEAGVPGVADPGSAVVRLAHERGIRVVPLTGPSSILLSLMASGLNGQQFTFHGYLPIKHPERVRKILQMERELHKKGETQIFMEAPYRNDKMLSDIVDTCQGSTLLCVAADITLDSEYIQTRPVSEWRNNRPSLHKRPSIFLLGK